MLTWLFGITLGSGEGRLEADEKRDEWGMQRVWSKGTETTLFGDTLYYLRVDGRRGKYYVNRAQYERTVIGQRIATC